MVQLERGGQVGVGSRVAYVCKVGYVLYIGGYHGATLFLTFNGTIGHGDYFA